MTFAELRQKFFSIRAAGILIVSTLLVTGLFYPWTTENQYQAAIALGVNLNSAQVGLATEAGAVDSQQAYVESFVPLSLYMERRFSSIEIQDLIASKAEIGVKSFSDRKPFYDITAQGSGFVSLSYKTDSAQQAEVFLQSVKSAYLQVVAEWNEQRPENFRITPMSKFTETVTVVARPTQLQLLPVAVGVMLGVIVVLLLPVRAMEVAGSKKNKSRK